MINIATLNEYKAALLLPPPLQNTSPTIYNSVTNSWGNQLNGDDMLNCPHMTIVQSSSVECWSLDLLLDNSSVRVLLPFRVVFLPSTHHSSYPSNDSPSSDQCALPLDSVIALGFLFKLVTTGNLYYSHSTRRIEYICKGFTISAPMTVNYYQTVVPAGSSVH